MKYEVVEHTADATAVLVGVAAFVNLLPAIAAAFTIVWLAIRIAESFMGRPLYTFWISRALRRQRKEDKDVD